MGRPYLPRLRAVASKDLAGEVSTTYKQGCNGGLEH